MSDTGGLLQNNTNYIDFEIIRDLRRILLENQINIEDLNNTILFPPPSLAKLKLQGIILSTIENKRFDGGGLKFFSNGEICILTITDLMKSEARARGAEDCDREILATGSKMKGVRLHISINQRTDLEDIGITIRSSDPQFDAIAIAQQLGGAGGSNRQMAGLAIKGVCDLNALRRAESAIKQILSISEPCLMEEKSQVPVVSPDSTSAVALDQLLLPAIPGLSETQLGVLASMSQSQRSALVAALAQAGASAQAITASQSIAAMGQGEFKP